MFENNYIFCMTQFDRTLKGKGVFSEKKIGGGVFSEYFFRSIFYKASEQILLYIYIYIYIYIELTINGCLCCLLVFGTLLNFAFGRDS